MHFHTLQDVGTTWAKGFHVNTQGDLTFYTGRALQGALLPLTGLGSLLAGSIAIPGHPIQVNEDGSESNFYKVLLAKMGVNSEREEEFAHSADSPNANPIKTGRLTNMTFYQMQRAAQAFYLNDDSYTPQVNRELYQTVKSFYLPGGWRREDFQGAQASLNRRRAASYDPGRFVRMSFNGHPSYRHWVGEYSKGRREITSAMYGRSPGAWSVDEMDAH